MEIFKKNGSFLIDEDKAYLLNGICWFIKKDKNSFYVKSKKHGYLHRMIVGAKKGEIVDHINGNPLDNRLSNLRLVTSSKNSMNRDTTSLPNKTSIYKGVHKTKHGWMTKIKVKGQKIPAKTFKTEIEAALKYNELALKYHGEFARLNNIN